MISVLVLTFNEEINIRRCLESLRWSDDVLVLDSFSEDRTVEMATTAGARILQRPFDDFASQRNFGLKHGNLKHDWALHLDADEIVTPEFVREVQHELRNPCADAYRVASKMMFQGQWLKYSGMYPTYQVRLGHREKLSFKQVGHGQRENLPADRVGTLKEPLLHFSFSKGMDDWKAKHERYAAAEARHFIEGGRSDLELSALFSSDPMRRRRAIKVISNHLPARPVLRFIYMYFLRVGFLDGSVGFHYCRLMAKYESMIVQQIRVLRSKR